MGGQSGTLLARVYREWGLYGGRGVTALSGPCTNHMVGCDMSVSPLGSYNKVAAVGAVCSASSSGVDDVVSLGAPENCKICCAAVCLWV